MGRNGKKLGTAALLIGAAAAASAVYRNRAVIRTLIEDTAERFRNRDEIVPVLDPDAAEVNVIIRSADCPENETSNEENAAEN